MAHINLRPLFNLNGSKDKGRNKKIVSHIHDLRQSHSDLDICRSLLDAVHCGSLPPTIFGIFLSASASLEAIILCMQNGPSCFIRERGIWYFGKALADPIQWESAWRAVGGSNGLVKLFEELPVTDVKGLARAIGRCNHPQDKVAAREKAIEELLSALLPKHYPGSQFQSHDKRPVQHHYAQMVSACSSEFVEDLLDSKDQSNPLYRQIPTKRLIVSHPELMQKRTIEGISGTAYTDDNLPQCLKAFAYSQSPGPGPDPRTSASMAFAIRALQVRLADVENNKRWPSQNLEADLLSSLIRRSIKRRLPEAEIHKIFKLGLQLSEARPTLRTLFRSKSIWSQLVARWERESELYEDVLELALRSELGGSRKKIAEDYYETSQKLHKSPEVRWKLLRLYCLYVPNAALDIDTADDFKPLAKQRWRSDIFYQLRRSQAVRLLKGLHNANPNRSFLIGPKSTSILRNNEVMSHRNFNVDLLLTIFQRDSKEAQKKAQDAVDELRNKAGTATEQADRAQLANAASAFAIASGNLDLYYSVVTWQQRYVRDPLTVRIIFGNDAVMTSEGIELLSGIPKQLPEGMTLVQVASRVEKADSILLAFHETVCIAKREPSFHVRTWNSVISLFGTAIMQRISRAEELQKHLGAPMTDIYTAIWHGFLLMLRKLDVSFLEQAYTLIIKVLDTFPPTVLATTAKEILRAGDENRKNQDRQSKDDELERLSYDVLLKLIKSDTPGLSQSFVIRTIIDRPDASSWHRRLLSVSFMKRLSAKDAYEILLAFAAGVGEKLEEQSYSKVGKTPSSPSEPNQSLVKVTTVKYLAQLLNNAEFISADAAIEVLVELFKVGTHRDIRLATLDSLLSVLDHICSGVDENWRTNALVEKVMGALETFIPVFGSINEMRPPQSKDWVNAETEGILPEVSDVSARLPPLLGAMLTAPNGQKHSGLIKLKAEFVSRFLLPIVDHLQAEHRQWLALFLAKHEADFTVDDLPPVPLTSLVWKTLVENYFELIPQAILEDFNKYIVMTIIRPAILLDFNRSFEENTDLRNTSEVKHWLSVFTESTGNYYRTGTYMLVGKIHSNIPLSSVPNGIQYEKVLDIVLTHASLILDQYEHYRGIWNRFVDQLRPPVRLTHPINDAELIRGARTVWEKSGRTLLEKVTALLIEKKKEYKRKHKHSILPSPARLRLWLLPYPCFPDSKELGHQCDTFGQKLDELLMTTLKEETNVLRWHKIQEDAFAASALLNNAEERLRVAIWVGGVTGSLNNSGDQLLSALRFLRVVAAMKLIEDGKEALENTRNGRMLLEYQNELANGVRERIWEWQKDPDEAIREKVADWKREKSVLWDHLMGEEETWEQPNKRRRMYPLREIKLEDVHAEGWRVGDWPGRDWNVIEE